MALFRKHRGCLDESLQTTVIVTNIQGLCEIIMEELYVWGDLVVNPGNIKIKPYPDTENCFDNRIGWYTQIVTLDIPKFGVIGFLSEPLDE